MPKVTIIHSISAAQINPSSSQVKQSSNKEPFFFTSIIRRWNPRGIGSIKKNTKSKFCQTDPAINATEFDKNIWKMQSRTKISCSSFFFFGAPGPEGDYKGDRWLSKLASLLMASQPPTSGTILPKNGSLGAILRTVSQTIGLVNMTINRAPCICHIRIFSWKLT